MIEQLALALDQEPTTAILAPDPTRQARQRSLHFIKYMGSKRNLLSLIAPVLRDVVPANGTLLDLFAGTHAIGYALKDHAAIWGNDIQWYSVPIGETLLLTDPLALVNLRTREIVPTLASAYFERSSCLFADWLARERAVFSRAQDDLQAGLEAYLGYIKDLEAVLPHTGNPANLPLPLRIHVERVMQGVQTDPPIMAAIYWANTYFSLEQALWLDAYRRAISDLPPGHEGHAPALAALLHAAAYCTHGSGHFAQHRKLTSLRVLEDALRYRLRSVAEYWHNKMVQIEVELATSRNMNRVTALDFRAALQSGLHGVSAIYADPPYSFVHYSRFYHVLETLTLYDHPGTEFDGRYRPVALRHQSPFCIRSQMRDAFEDVLRAGREASVPIIWSYSKSGLMPFGNLVALCRQFYPRVEIMQIDYLHTTMGRRGDKTREVTEVLIVCG